MAMGGLSRPIVGLLAFLQIACALAIIIITAIHMANVDVTQLSSAWQQLTGTCLLAPGGNIAICLYVYALGVVSLVFTLSIGLMQICTCNKCGCGAVMDTVFAIMAAAWWLVGAFVVSSNTTKANAEGLPARQWRDAVAIMTWVMTGLFAALFSVHLLRVCHKFCKRCGGRRRGESDKALSGSGGAARAAALELGKEVRARPYMTGGSSLQQQFGSTNNI